MSFPQPRPVFRESPRSFLSDLLTTIVMDALYDQMSSSNRRPVSRAYAEAPSKAVDMKQENTDVLDHILLRANNTSISTARK